MRRLLVLCALSALLVPALSCQEEEPTPDCQTPATLRDLTGLDGCGYVLELADGQRLEPHGAAWEAYSKHDGERVTISYIDDPAVGICMVGRGVELKCIQQQYGRCGTVTPGKAN